MDPKSSKALKKYFNKMQQQKSKKLTLTEGCLAYTAYRLNGFDGEKTIKEVEKNSE